MTVVDLDADELVEMLLSGTLSAPGDIALGTVFRVSLDAGIEGGWPPPPLGLAGFGAVIVGTTGAGAAPREAPGAGWCDVVVDGRRDDLDRIIESVERAPIAATSLVQVLRGADRRPFEDAMLMESAVYSALQAGPEFARWRGWPPAAGRAGPHGGRGRRDAAGRRDRGDAHEAAGPQRPEHRDARPAHRGAGPRACGSHHRGMSSSKAQARASAAGATWPSSVRSVIRPPPTSSASSTTSHASCTPSLIGARSGCTARASGRGSSSRRWPTGSSPAPTRGSACPSWGLASSPGRVARAEHPATGRPPPDGSCAPTARPIDAETALEWGLVDVVQPPTP